MIKLKSFALVAALAGGLLSFPNANAMNITGSIDFTGGDISTFAADGTTPADLTTATTLKFSGSTVVASGAEGAYEDIAAGTAVAFSAATLTFDPLGSGVSPLWTIVYAGIKYQFNLLAVTEVVRSSNTNSGGITHDSLSLFGTGTATIVSAGDDSYVGYSTTEGAWSLAATGKDGKFKFSFTSSNTSSGEHVPDGGASLALLGLGLTGIGAFRRKLGMI